MILYQIVSVRSIVTTGFVRRGTRAAVNVKSWVYVMNAIIFTGLQASGKSTYYRHRYFNSHVRVNLDMLKGSRSKERKLIEGCLSGNIPCVIDNTNLTIAHRRIYIEQFANAGYEIYSCFFDSSIDECLSRNKDRTDKAPIPVVALYAGIRKLQVPSQSEGFESVSAVTISNDGEYAIRYLD